MLLTITSKGQLCNLPIVRLKKLPIKKSANRKKLTSTSALVDIFAFMLLIHSGIIYQIWLKVRCKVSLKVVQNPSINYEATQTAVCLQHLLGGIIYFRF